MRQVSNIFDREFTILKIQLLSDVADRLLERLTVVIDLSACSKAVVGLIKKEIVDEMSDEDRQKANTDLYFELLDKSLDVTVPLHARDVKVRVTSDIVDFLQNQEGLQCKINNRLVSAVVTDEADSDETAEMLEEMLDD